VNSPFQTVQAFPPSLSAHPLLSLASIATLLFGSLLCLQWLQRVVMALWEDRYPYGHPVTVERTVTASLIAAALAISVPRLVLVMAWGSISPPMREQISAATWTIYIPWAVMMAFAWFRARQTAPLMRYQLRKSTIDRATEAEPDKKTGAIMLVLVLIIAITVTYVRPAPNDVPAGNHAPGTISPGS
jgi:hypothetical protein